LEDEHAIGALVRGLVDAWNACDPDAFAALFAPSADYVTGRGERVHGPDGIADLVQQAAAGSAVSMTGQPTIERDGLAATVRFGWATTKPHEKEREGIITCTLTRQGARWVIQTLRNQETE
jgi:uncharacterized protein (TIGR02246 family)